MSRKGDRRGDGVLTIRTMCVPRNVIAAIGEAADARGAAVSLRHEQFHTLLNELNLDRSACLRELLRRLPARLLGVTDGLTRGVYILPTDGSHAWAFHSHEGVREIEEPTDEELVISYSREDRDLALKLQETLAGAGCKAFLIDVDANPDDRIWWLRFSAAMTKARYFIPLLSASYARRPGSYEELREASALCVTRAERTAWYPILPALLDNQERERSTGARSGILQELPSLPVHSASEREVFAQWVKAVVDAETDGGRALERLLRSRSTETCDREIAGVPFTSYRLGREWGAEAVVLQVHNNVPRLAPLPPTDADFGPILDLQATDVQLELEASALRSTLRPAEAVVRVATGIRKTGADASRLIELAKSLEDSGREGHAFVCYREAENRLNDGHGDKTKRLVSEAANRLARYAPFVESLDIAAVVASHARSDRSKPQLVQLDVPAEGIAATSSCRGIRDYFERARDASESGDHYLAQMIMLAAFHHTVSDKNRARTLYFASCEALAQGLGTEACALASLGLDFDPNSTQNSDVLKHLLD